MSKELQTLMDAIKAITKKEDKPFTMAIKEYMGKNGIKPFLTDTMDNIPDKFGLDIKEPYRNIITTYSNTMEKDGVIDNIDFMYYLNYILICLIKGKKVPITIPMKIGEINVYKNALLKEILVTY